MPELITLNNVDSDAVDSMIALATNNATLDGTTTLSTSTEKTSLPEYITEYVLQSTLVSSDRSVGDYLGISVSISGDGVTAIVGARYEDTGGASTGAAYMFEPEITFFDVSTYDISQNSIFTHSGLTADFTANFTNVPTTNDRSISVAIIINQGATGYLPTAVQIDGVAQTILWETATAPTATINGTDIARFTLVRSADTWSVLGTVTAFGSV